MQTPEPQSLLKVWENCVHASPTMRGLLLMGVALPHVDTDALLNSSIGHRDAWLLNLREVLFGARMDCLLPCRACGQQVELDFRVSDIRAPHAEPQHVCEVAVEDATFKFRVPTSADLFAVEGVHDSRRAEELLLRRLWVGTQEPVHAITMEVEESVAQAIGNADRQAEVLLEMSCPACGQQGQELFDIAAHLWCELDHWARGLLGKVHMLACRYGWSEECILSMGTARRQAYLALVGAG